MSGWMKMAKAVIRLLDGLVDLIALVLIVCAMLLSGYSLWDANQIYEEANASAYEAYIPTEEDTRSFEEFTHLNPEVIGWLRVNDTNINYPLVQAEDNETYVNTDAEGKYSLSGAIFLDCANKPDFSDFGNVIYGHHMEKHKMFGDIGLFSEKEYFDTHPYGNLFFDGKDHGIEFFAQLRVDAYDKLFVVHRKTEAEDKEYLDRIWELAEHKRDMDVTIKDHLVLLSTCTTSMTNGRSVLVGRLTDRIYPQEEKKPQVNLGTGVEMLGNLVEEFGIWIWIIPAVILLMIIIVIVQYVRKRKRRKERKQ